MASSKTCFKCGLLKPLAEFYPHKQMGDGHLNKCKVCARKDVSANRASNIAYVRAYDRTRAGLPHRRKQAKIIAGRWRRQFPNRRYAQGVLAKAVAAGKVERWPCQICGEKAEGHHTDYENPLGVTWLCSPHHKQTHAFAKTLC